MDAEDNSENHRVMAGEAAVGSSCGTSRDTMVGDFPSIGDTQVCFFVTFL